MNAYYTKMIHFYAIELTPHELIRDYGDAAPGVVTAMIDRAIKLGQTDKALELDRVRRVITRSLAA